MTPSPDADAQVRAAGAVVWRLARPATATGHAPAPSPCIEVLLVHRPRYDDWSHPKGKLDEGETFEAAAVREIAEETGVIGELGADLGSITYADQRGRPKIVRWWALRAEEVGAPDDTDEVDELRWLPLADARDLLTYPTDAEVLDRFRATVQP